MKRPVCNCHAYPFPHRKYGGACAGVNEPTCEACGKACDTKEIDFGIGSFEAHGEKGFDRRVGTVSKCCEAPVSSA